MLFRPFKSKRSALVLGLVAFFSVVTIGAIALPSVSFPLAEALVGNFANKVSTLPTGKVITPLAAPGSTFRRLATGLRSDGTADAQGAVATAISPDGQKMLVLTSGYNLNFRNETTGAAIVRPVLDPVTGQPSAVNTNKAEWVFVYDINGAQPAKVQQINLPNTYNGIVWAPDGQKFYVSGGIDDRIYVYTFNGTEFVPDAPFILLGHNTDQTLPFPKYDGGLLKNTPADTASNGEVVTGAAVAGLAISQDGNTLVAANFMSDSISVVDTATRAVVREIPFFQPGGQVATGEFPFWVAIVNDSQGAAARAYVTSQRDDEVLAVNLADGQVTRIPVGVQPNKLLLTQDQSRLYVANGNSDSVSVIDTGSDRVVRTISVARPGERYWGAIPNSLALSPNEQTLYVTLAGENAIAVVNLKNAQVVGRIPTGWYPNSVSVAPNGKKLYAVNAKSNSGPNPAANRTTPAATAANTTFRNDYGWALVKAGLSTIPVPNRRTLSALSDQVDRNNGFAHRGQADPTMAFLQDRIKHVIYVVKENRTYDQVLGDLPIGNGDPTLTLLPEPISPNHHKLALDYVTLDNFYDSGESSGVGWNWTTYAATTDFTEKDQSVLYGNAGFNGLTYDYEGTNRNINIFLPQTASNPNQITTRVTGLLDPTGQSNILPGNKDVNAPPGDGDLRRNAVGGYLWDAALRAGKTVRNYGFYVDLAYTGTTPQPTGTPPLDPTQPDPNNPLYLPISATPFADGLPQAPPATKSLQDKTDIFFRGYDMKNADIYLLNEFMRDVDANGGLADLTLLRLPHDHFGNFADAVAGLNTVNTQMADNDYALGLLIEKMSQRPEWNETAIFVIEDDSQNGPDHVDSHRSIAYIISPYTKRNALVSTRYTTVNMIRTMEDVLGAGYLGINDANAKPMADVFTRQANLATYQAIVPGVLCQAPVDPNLVPACQDDSAPKTVALKSRHDGAWWANATKDFYFGDADKLDEGKFNHVLWSGIKGDAVPYPTARSGADLRQNRAQLLAQAHAG
jgi:YVTN family beta-propeller protein